MKKMMIFAAVVAALVLSSCKEEKACWEVNLTQKMDMMGETQSVTTTFYVYGTESDVEAEVKTMKGISASMPGVSVTYDVTKKKVDKAESDCMGVSL